MTKHDDISDVRLRRMIRSGEIVFGGNIRLKIFGHLNCQSGKRMKKSNRIFFSSSDEAIAAGFRPCGNCMKDECRLWFRLH